jgi:dihydropteroate synthase
MNYVDPSDNCIETMLSSFKSVFDLFKENGLNDRLIFDPGLGFSKNYDQNWMIINNFKLWEKKLKQIDPNYVLLIGMSKKSFLQKSLIGSDSKKEDSEFIHYILLNELKELTNSKILFRVHEIFT